METRLAPTLTVADVEDVLASLSFEGASVSDRTRALFMAVAAGELTMEQAMAHFVAAHAHAA